MKKIIFVWLIAIQALSAQEFDFECVDELNEEVQGYVADFFAVAEKKGLDFSGVTGQAVLKDIDNDGEWKNNGTQVGGRAYKICYDNEYYIELDRPFFEWVTFVHPSYKRFIVFHELGHDILNLDHNCTFHRFRGFELGSQYTDIMWTGATCPSLSGYNYIFGSEAIWNEAVDHMFDEDTHVDFDCGTSKGAKVIDDVF